jgi:ribosome-associated protein
MKTVEISEEFIKLDALLKHAGISGSGGQAKMMIQEGLVKLNGTVATERGKKVHIGDIVKVATTPPAEIKVVKAV